MENQQEPGKLRRVVIKQELVELTGHWRTGLILNQFLYWLERRSDIDQYLIEERERNPDLQILLTHGWIYKSAKQLLEELMIGVSEETLRRGIKSLVERQWLQERNNPDQRWDHKLQYRPNIRRIQEDLQALGYALEGYPLLLKDRSFMVKDRSDTMKDRSTNHEGTIAETTTETTYKEEQQHSPKQPRTKQRDERLDHPAVKAYRDLCRLTPNAEARAAIADTVVDLDHWKETCRSWMLKGYRPQNVEGLLDFYQRDQRDQRATSATASPVASTGMDEDIHIFSPYNSVYLAMSREQTMKEEANEEELWG